MAQNQSNTQEEKRGKKKWLLLLLLLLLGLFIIGGIPALAIILTQQPTQSGVVIEVVVDPMMSTQDGDNHIEGAETFSLDLDRGNNEHSKEVNETLSNAETYIYYTYTLTNDSSKNVTWKLEFQDLQNEGFIISYQIGTGVKREFSGDGITSLLHANDTQTIYIYFEIENPSVNAIVDGTLKLTVSLM